MPLAVRWQDVAVEKGAKGYECTNVTCVGQGNKDNLYEVSIEESAIEDEQLPNSLSPYIITEN